MCSASACVIIAPATSVSLCRVEPCLHDSSTQYSLPLPQKRKNRTSGNRSWTSGAVVVVLSHTQTVRISTHKSNVTTVVARDTWPASAYPAPSVNLGRHLVPLSMPQSLLLLVLLRGEAKAASGQFQQDVLTLEATSSWPRGPQATSTYDCTATPTVMWGQILRT